MNGTAGKPLIEVVGDLSIVIRSPRTARVYGVAFDAVDGDEQVTVTELDDDAPYRAEDWPITHDAGPILCGLCRQELVGTGYGVVSALLRVVDGHMSTCPGLTDAWQRAALNLAEQDGEYLHDAHAAITTTLADIAGAPESEWHDVASEVLDRLANAGWHLLTTADTEKLLSAVRGASTP